MDIVEKIIGVLKKIGNIWFWSIASTTFIVLSIAGYFVGSALVYGGYLDKYQKLNPFIKEFVSIQDWWIEQGKITNIFQPKTNNLTI